VFFDNERGKISHVGMILSRGLVIHSSGRVRIDSIDHQGIFQAGNTRVLASFEDDQAHIGLNLTDKSQ